MPDTTYAWFHSLSDSVFALGAAARQHRAHLHENTCLAYAYGAAESVRLVSQGERPRHIELRRHDGLYVLPPTSLLPDLGRALAGWPGSKRLSQLRAEVMRHEFAASMATAEPSDDDPDDPTDHEASEVFPASEFTASLADSAYAYGEVAESALNYLLLAARANHFPEEDTP
ncbi:MULTISPECIES: hypothetical protein [unclassified Streptomyces]|uniref:Uncharacterized protein n=1 Tax=Streptomyces sp. NBC_00060 TaxID=2975636 RepID=A0AAU2GZ90_9ACTN